MTRCYERYKDIPLGLIIKKDLMKRGMSQKDLARLLHMSYFNLNRALNGQAYLNSEQATSIDRFFGYEESFTLRMQLNERDKRMKFRENEPIAPFNVPLIRTCVFWDTDIHSLDWLKHRNFIERRIASHGNLKEKAATMKFYASLKTS